jgi:hypothetical protein
MTAAVFIAMFMGLFLAIFFPLMMSSGGFKAAQEKARARRLADAKMNARLLRMNL